MYHSIVNIIFNVCRNSHLFNSWVKTQIFSSNTYMINYQFIKLVYIITSKCLHLWFSICKHLELDFFLFQFTFKHNYSFTCLTCVHYSQYPFGIFILWFISNGSYWLFLVTLTDESMCFFSFFFGSHQALRYVWRSHFFIYVKQ